MAPVTSGGPHGILFQKNVAKLKNYLLNQQTSHVKFITQFKQDKENILLSPSTTVWENRKTAWRQRSSAPTSLPAFKNGEQQHWGMNVLFGGGKWVFWCMTGGLCGAAGTWNDFWCSDRNRSALWEARRVNVLVFIRLFTVRR